MSAFEDIERRREVNEGAHPEETAYDETGNFAVRVVFLDGVDRTAQDGFTSLRAALAWADGYTLDLRKKNYTRTMVHVGVIDVDDPERGELDWDDLDG